MNVAEAARVAHQLGLTPLPVRSDGSKAPDVHSWTQWQHEQPALEQIDRWFPSTRCGVGLVCGAASRGLEMVELEGRALVEGVLDDLLELTEHEHLDRLLERVMGGYQETTPSGGIHWLYRSPGAVTGNQKLASRPATTVELEANPHDRVKVLIETRGEGGFVVIAPSNGTTHPTGGAWRLDMGGLDTIAVITPEERGQLLRLCHLLDRTPEPARPSPPRRPASPTSHGDETERPGDAYTAATSWPGVLEPHGWTWVFNRGDIQHWRRPGKHKGISATVNANGGDRLVVHSTSTPFQPSPSSYDRFGAHVLLDHGGDHTAAARALRHDGYGAPPPNRPTAGPAAPAAGNDVGDVPPEKPATPIWAPDGHHLTDAGNAARFARNTGGHLRYAPEWQRWVAWDGRVWQVDHASIRTDRAARQVADSLWALVADTAGKERDAVIAWAKRSESAPTIAACARLARAEPGLAVDHELFDADPWILNVANGILDLRTGDLRPHDPDALLTKLAPVTWNPEATAPRFLRFLEEVQPDPAVRTYLQRHVGYSLTGVVTEHTFPVHTGGGANGKSTFISILNAILGSYAGVATKDLIVVQRHDAHPTSKADLFRLRLAVAVEVEQSARLDETQVKELTGGDRVKARRMREDYWHFQPTHKLWLVANHLPTIRGGDEGIWRRVKKIDWPVTITDDRKDPHLADTIIGHELEGILTWAVQGCLDWQAAGLGEPDSVTAATDSYRSDQDQVGSFLDDEDIRFDPADTDLTCATKELFERYVRWCTRNSLDPMRADTLGKELKRRGCHDFRKRPTGGSTQRFWRGIGFDAERSW